MSSLYDVPIPEFKDGRGGRRSGSGRKKIYKNKRESWRAQSKRYRDRKKAVDEILLEEQLDLEEDNADLQSKVGALREVIDVQESEIESVKRKKSDLLENFVEQLESSSAKLLRLREESDNEISQLARVVDAQQQEINTARTTSETVKADYEELNNRTTALKKRLRTQEEEIAKLKMARFEETHKKMFTKLSKFELTHDGETELERDMRTLDTEFELLKKYPQVRRNPSRRKVVIYKQDDDDDDDAPSHFQKIKL